MTPQEERALAQEYARRIANILSEIDAAEDHGLIVYVEKDGLVLDGKYGIQARVHDTGKLEWTVE